MVNADSTEPEQLDDWDGPTLEEEVAQNRDYIKFAGTVTTHLDGRDATEYSFQQWTFDLTLYVEHPDAGADEHVSIGTAEVLLVDDAADVANIFDRLDDISAGGAELGQLLQRGQVSLDELLEESYDEELTDLMVVYDVRIHDRFRHLSLGPEVLAGLANHPVGRHAAYLVTRNFWSFMSESAEDDRPDDAGNKRAEAANERILEEAGWVRWADTDVFITAHDDAAPIPSEATMEPEPVRRRAQSLIFGSLLIAGSVAPKTHLSLPLPGPMPEDIASGRPDDLEGVISDLEEGVLIVETGRGPSFVSGRDPQTMRVRSQAGRLSPKETRWLKAAAARYWSVADKFDENIDVAVDAVLAGTAEVKPGERELAVISFRYPLSPWPVDGASVTFMEDESAAPGGVESIAFETTADGKERRVGVLRQRQVGEVYAALDDDVEVPDEDAALEHLVSVGVRAAMKTRLHPELTAIALGVVLGVEPDLSDPEPDGFTAMFAGL